MDTNKSFWEKTAKLYTPVQEKTNRRLYEKTSRCCEKYICSNSRVLELACGTGQFTYPLHGIAEHWEATDFSEEMLKETRKRCPSVHTSVEDASALSFKDNEFTTVLIANALHIMPEPEKALSEIRRVLTDGGILLAPTFLYEGKINRLRMWLTSKAGFRTYHKWSMDDFIKFIETSGFQIIEKKLINGDPLPEGFIAAGKSSHE